MGRLTERELTRLSFLMSSVVASPALSNRLIERVAAQSTGPFEELLRDFQQRVLARSAVPTRGILRDIVVELLDTGEPDKLTAARLLAGAIETASASNAPPSP